LEQECGENTRNIMNTKTVYKDDDARYTDAPPEVDAALDYAIEHNLFLTREQFENLLESSKQKSVVFRPKAKSHRTLRKVTAMV
jgi:hypothetical protein